MIWTSNGDHKMTINHAHKDWIWSITALQNGGFATGSADRTIKVWDRNGVNVKTLQGHTGWVLAIVELENGYLASASQDKTVRIWNVNNE